VLFVERGKICLSGCVVVRKRLLPVFRVKDGTSACERYVFLIVKCWEAESCWRLSKRDEVGVRRFPLLLSLRWSLLQCLY
jgi:hypothetical protein